MMQNPNNYNPQMNGEPPSNGYSYPNTMPVDGNHPDYLANKMAPMSLNSQPAYGGFPAAPQQMAAPPFSPTQNFQQQPPQQPQPQQYQQQLPPMPTGQPAIPNSYSNAPAAGQFPAFSPAGAAAPNMYPANGPPGSVGSSMPAGMMPQPAAPGMYPPGSGASAMPPTGMYPPSSAAPGMMPPPTGPGMYPPGSVANSMPGMMPTAGPGMPGMMPPPTAPGMFPAGGQMNQPGAFPQGPPGMLGQMGGQLAPKKPNPDLMPSAIDVMESDRSNHSGSVFSTGQRGVLPPLVTTAFSCRDEGNCNPRFIRSSMYGVPNSADLLKTCVLPFTITCCPFAQLHPNDQPVMLSDMGKMGPVRCNRCKAYMSPMMVFFDGGRRFKCMLCGGATDCPEEYFAHCDHTGRRTDSYQRPELCLGSYELTTTLEYCRNDKMSKPPAFIFLIDVSQAALRSGMVNLFCSRFVSDILPNLPKDEQAELQYRYMLQMYDQQGEQGGTPQGPRPEAPRSEISVGFITYDRHLHFYNFLSVKPAQQQNGHHQNGHTEPKRYYAHPRMNIIADTQAMFVPGVEGFFVPGDSVEAIQSLLDLIPQHFMGEGAPVPQPDPLLAPAIEAGLEALKAAERPGKLFVLHSSLPTAEAPGRLKNRDERALIGTDKEKTLLAPANDLYTSLGQKCVQSGCSVDLFLMPASYIDIATVSVVPKLTGGHVYKYNCFLAETHGEDLVNDLSQAVSRPRAFDCVMRIRTSAGTRPVEFLGHGLVPNTTEVEVAAIDRDWALSVEIKHDDKLPDGDVVFIQAAVLYTALNGQRRLRIHNLSLNTINTAVDLFRLSDLDCHVNWMAKSLARSVLVKPSKQVMEELTQRIAVTLAAYRKHCCTQYNTSSTGELVLPETLKLLPLFGQCLIKSDIVRPANEIAIDDRSLLLFLVQGMNVATSAAYFYPRLVPVHNLNPDGDDIPVGIRCSYERLQPNGAYLLENGVNMFLWVGNGISQEWIQAVFDVPSIQQLPEGAVLREKDNATSKRLTRLVSQLRMQHTRFCKLIVIRQGDRSEIWLKHFMYEDRTENCPSYVDYLCHIHREVRSLLK